jgi:hypothetical protein
MIISCHVLQLLRIYYRRPGFVLHCSYVCQAPPYTALQLELPLVHLSKAGSATQTHTLNATPAVHELMFLYALACFVTLANAFVNLAVRLYCCCCSAPQCC